MPNKLDRSILIRLTPDEIIDLMKDFAERYHESVMNESGYTSEELAKSYYEFHIGTLPEVEPDEDLVCVPRLEFNN